MSTWRTVRIAGADPAMGLARGGPEAEGAGGGGQRLDEKSEMPLQRDTELLGAAIDVLTVHRPREALVLELLDHRRGLEPGDGTAGPHERARGDEAGRLVAGVERAVEQRSAQATGVVGVGEDGVDDVRGHPPRGEDLGALQGVLRAGGMHLVVEVLQHARDPPGLAGAAVDAG